MTLAYNWRILVFTALAVALLNGCSGGSRDIDRSIGSSTTTATPSGNNEEDPTYDPDPNVGDPITESKDYLFVGLYNGNGIAAYPIQSNGFLADPIVQSTLHDGQNPSNPSLIITLATRETQNLIFGAFHGTGEIQIHSFQPQDGTMSLLSFHKEQAADGYQIAVRSMALHPTKNVFYVVYERKNTSGTVNYPGYVMAYSYNPNTGAIAKLNEMQTQVAPYFVNVDPEGKFAYTSDYSDGVTAAGISHFSINPSDGSLGAGGFVGTSPKRPWFSAFNPVNSKFYVGLYLPNPGAIRIFDQNLFTGNLAFIKDITMPGSSDATLPRRILVSDNGNHLYVSTRGSTPSAAHVIRVYNTMVEGSDLALSQQINMSGKGPIDIQFNPARTHLYSANYDSASIFTFSIASDGKLTFVNDKAIVTQYGSKPNPMVSGRFTYSVE